MKKPYFILLAVMLAGCSSFESLLAKIDEMTDQPAAASNTTSGSSNARAGRSYNLPADYAAAYSYRTDRPDPQMTRIPQNIESLRVNNPAEYVKQIAGYINGNSQNDFERVKKAHDLTAVLVRYDAANFWANTVPDQYYANVLKTKLAVCEGYSNLFKKLCDELKIKCDIVHGFGRGVGTSPFAGDTPANSNHAWNIVTINDESYLVDCTWDSGYMDGRTAKQEYTTDWLFLKPEHFLHTHFPENQRQQLVEKPLTAAQFLELPFYKPKYFEIAGTVSPAMKNINQLDGKLVLEYNAKDGFELDYSIYDESGSRQFQNCVFSQRTADTYKTYLSFPQSGKYLLRVFWKKAGAKMSAGCGELGIISTTGSGVQYPTQYSSSGKNVTIFSPIEMPLKRGTVYNFKIKVDNKNIVAIIHGKTFVQLTKGDDGIFFGDFEIPNNIRELSVGIADSERGRYETITQYQVK